MRSMKKRRWKLTRSMKRFRWKLTRMKRRGWKLTRSVSEETPVTLRRRMKSRSQKPSG